MKIRIIETIASNEHSLEIVTTQSQPIFVTYVHTLKIELTATILGSSKIRDTRVGINVEPSL